MFRLYITTNELPHGWSIENHGTSQGNKLVGPDHASLWLLPEGPEYYISMISEVPPEIPQSMLPAISRVTIKNRINDDAHRSIIDCGEHHAIHSATARVCANYKFGNDQRIDYIEVLVYGKTVADVVSLYQKIMRGRQADEPYYKITSLKRWWLIRFKRWYRIFTSGWVNMNTRMRGEA